MKAINNCQYPLENTNQNKDDADKTVLTMQWNHIYKLPWLQRGV